MRAKVTPELDRLNLWHHLIFVIVSNHQFFEQILVWLHQLALNINKNAKIQYKNYLNEGKGDP